MRQSAEGEAGSGHCHWMIHIDLVIEAETFVVGPDHKALT